MVGLAAVVGALGCATATEWRHPSLPEARWKSDATDCRRAATARVEEEAARAEHYGEGGPRRPADGASTTTTREAMMSRHELERRQRQLTEQCMKALGYLKDKSGDA